MLEIVEAPIDFHIILPSMGTNATISRPSSYTTNMVAKVISDDIHAQGYHHLEDKNHTIICITKDIPFIIMNNETHTNFRIAQSRQQGGLIR